jgi:hypothetical protein
MDRLKAKYNDFDPAPCSIERNAEQLNAKRVPVFIVSLDLTIMATGQGDGT